MLTGIAPVKQAFVRALRDIADLKSAIGSDGIHEGSVAQGTDYPYVTYQVRPTRYIRQFGNEAAQVSIFEILVVSHSQVEAQNLDRLILNGLENKALDFEGSVPDPSDEPSSLLCHRVANMSFGDVDAAGTKVYQVGGVYEIWTDRL